MGFLYELVNHLRLVWRLFWDDDVRWWHRVVFVVPVAYLVIPFRYDLVVDLAPIVGLLDDWLLAVLCTYVFTFLCPRRIVRRHRGAIALSDPDPNERERARSNRAMLETLSAAERLEMYRHPREPLALALSIFLLIGLSALGGLLMGGLLIVLLGVSYAVARLAHGQSLRRAIPVHHESYPRVQACLDRCYGHLPYVQIDVYVIESSRLDAYTFGIDRPYSMVLHSGLVEALSEDELVAVIGREMGHLIFEHTFFSSLMGGILYRSGLISLGWSLVFLRWRRLAERTADRISLLACGQLDAAMRALIKLAVGSEAETVDVERILDRVYGQDRTDLLDRLGELVGAYPQLVARLRALVDFDAELFALDVEDWLAADGPR
jgi:Zn-dependent protease with chaperone function